MACLVVKAHQIKILLGWWIRKRRPSPENRVMGDHTQQADSGKEMERSAPAACDDYDGDHYCGAFIQRFQINPPPFSSCDPLPLQGLTFAIKDM